MVGDSSCSICESHPRTNLCHRSASGDSAQSGSISYNEIKHDKFYLVSSSKRRPYPLFEPQYQAKSIEE